jgi:hypothetical protein
MAINATPFHFPTMMKRTYHPRKEKSQSILLLVCAFLFGCVISGSILLNLKVTSDTEQNTYLPPPEAWGNYNVRGGGIGERRTVTLDVPEESKDSPDDAGDASGEGNEIEEGSGSILRNVKTLVAITSFDFAQIPHLEEVLSAYHDVCVAGAHVDVVIFTTVAYPVTFIDMLNARFTCPHFSLTIILKPKSLRLHLVDCHRPYFYDKIDDYDLFIYTEDDIRVNAGVVAAYLEETKRIGKLLKGQDKYKPSDFNVGIVRYEYNYPSNVVIDDKTRHATQNVTRVYWEHGRYPVVPKAVEPLEQDPLKNEYIAMANRHQGMFLATRDLLLAWKDREKCQFNVVRDRPGEGGQPSMGTQRVWMSSVMLLSRKYCNVQQAIPRDRFGTLTVLHLP